MFCDVSLGGLVYSRINALMSTMGVFLNAILGFGSYVLVIGVCIYQSRVSSVQSGQFS